MVFFTKSQHYKIGLVARPAWSPQAVGHKLRVLQTLVDAQKNALKKLTECLREAEAQKSTLVFDIETEEFEEAADMNIQRYKHGSIVIAGRLYVFGGWIADKVSTCTIEMLPSRFATEW